MFVSLFTNITYNNPMVWIYWIHIKASKINQNVQKSCFAALKTVRAIATKFRQSVLLNMVHAV